MKPLSFFLFVLLLATFPEPLRAQRDHVVRGADERFNADILAVVAHPDDSKQFAGSWPAYSVREISPAQRIGMETGPLWWFPW